MRMKTFVKILFSIICCVAVLSTTGCRLFLPREGERDSIVSGNDSSLSMQIESSSEDTHRVETSEDSDTLNRYGIPLNLEVEDGKIISRGDWGAYYKWDYTTNVPFKVYMQIESVTTNSENSSYVKRTIQEYNNALSESNVKHRYLSEDDLKDGLEYAVIDVNVYIPKGQAVSDYNGVPLPLNLNIKGDGSWKDKDGNICIFTTTVNDFKIVDNKFSAGDYCHTKLIYSIIKDTPTSYGLEGSYQIPRTDVYGKITFRFEK